MRDQLSQVQAARDAVTAIATTYELRENVTEGVRWKGVDAVRTRLRQLVETAKRECWSFNPGGAHRPEAMSTSRMVDQVALEQGVQMLCVYQCAYLNNANAVAYADWLTGLGAEIRTVPTVPMQLIVVDREVAMLINPTSGRHNAIEVRTPLIVAAICALFMQVWDVSVPMTGRTAPAVRAGANGRLRAFEQAVLRLLAEGLTDESASRRLGVSVRTLRRTMSEITVQLQSNSRFQAGVEANRRGWI